MAKKKDKPQVINNIQELNLEIDYDKLAEAIVKAQEKSAKKNAVHEKIGFWKSAWLIIINKEKTNRNRTALLLANIMSTLFNFLSLFGLGIAILLVYFTMFHQNWNIALSQIIIQIIYSAILFVMCLLLSLLFRGLANEISVEKDRSYIISLFFGFAGLGSLVVALVELFRG